VKIKLNALTALFPFSILIHSPPLWSLVPSPSVIKNQLSWIFLFLLCNSSLCSVHFSLHLPISKFGIRLIADVASCSFSYHDYVTGHSQYENHDSTTNMGLITEKPYVTSSFLAFFFLFFIYIFFEKGIQKIKIKKVIKIWLKSKLKN